mgnify:CR=1 FL=1
MRKTILFLFICFFPSYLFSMFLFCGNKRETIFTVTKGNWVYVSLDDLEKVFNITSREEQVTKKVILNFPAHTLTFVSMNPYYLVDDRCKKLFLPFLQIDGKSFVSLPDIKTVLSNGTEREIIHLYSLNALVVDRNTFNPDSIIRSSEDDKICFTLISENELVTSSNDDKKGKLQLTLFNAVCKPTIIPPTDGDDVIKKILLQQEKNKAILSFFYEPGMIKKISSELAEPMPSIKITFYKKKKKINDVEKPKRKHIINKIVIDPGHGGRDSGAVGATGLTEKETVLKIARELQRILKSKGFTVIMTREDDSFVRLRQRSRLANNSGADLFVSIHCNATGRRLEAGGFETFFLSTAKTSWARAVEAKENSVIQFEAPSEKESTLDYILWDLAQNEYLRESSDLAEYIQESLRKYTTIEDRGVKQANFHVMREIYMPSVLVETAFISNLEEEKSLKKAGFRKKLAEGIAEGILKFKKMYEKKLNK